MPPVRLVIFQNHEESVPFLDWFQGLEDKARAKCQARLKLLSREGFSLRRPVADYLRDGVYELRFKVRGVNFRVLYFYFGRDTVVVSHGLSKQAARVPSPEIDQALKNMTVFEKDPEAHTFD